MTKLTTSNSAQDICSKIEKWLHDQTWANKEELILKSREYKVEKEIQHLLNEFEKIKKEYWYLKNQEGRYEDKDDQQLSEKRTREKN